MYSNDLPDWVKRAGKTFITLSISDWSDSNMSLKVNPDDVAKYYAYEARSMSGCRTLAGHTGDWRPIDELASFCLEYFKHVNVDGMRKAGRKYGLEPKF